MLRTKTMKMKRIVLQNLKDNHNPLGNEKKHLKFNYVKLSRN